jgi:hypothetical protein
MDVKNILLSKTLWLNILGPVFAWLATKGIELDPETQAAVIVLLMSALNIIMRRFTNQPVSLSAPIGKPASGAANTLLVMVCMLMAASLLSACGSKQIASGSSSNLLPPTTTILAASAGATALAPSAVAIVNNIKPQVVAGINEACPMVQGALAAAMACASGGATGANGAIAQAQNLAGASCSEAGKLQLVVNDATAAATGPTPTNSGNSAAWLKLIATDAIALAPYACPVAKAIIAGAK